MRSIALVFSAAALLGAAAPAFADECPNVKTKKFVPCETKRPKTLGAAIGGETPKENVRRREAERERGRVERDLK
jgi:hypothetical protein